MLLRGGDLDKLKSRRLRGAALTDDVFLRAGRFRRSDLESLGVLPRRTGGVIE